MNMHMHMHIWRVHGKGRNYGGKELLLTYYFFFPRSESDPTEDGIWAMARLGSLVGTERSSQLSLGSSGGLEYHLKPSFAHICLDACMDG